MLYDSRNPSPCYFPPILGNGDISLAPDAEGMLHYKAQEYKEKGITAFDGILVRCGRRTSLNKTLTDSKLFSLGSLRFSLHDQLSHFTQCLEVERGLVHSSCQYAEGSVIQSEAFIHPTRNIYVLRKLFMETAQTEVYYDYILEGYNPAIAELTHILYTHTEGREVHIGFKLYGMDIYIGEVRLYADTEFRAEPLSNGVRLFFPVTRNTLLTLYLYLEDNLECADVPLTLADIKRCIDQRGYAGLREDCETSYADYFSQGYVQTGDLEIDATYKTALYCLKCYTTKYSIPIGLNNGYWNGRYFAFDEYYNFFGLLTSGQAALAKRVPAFRLDICLEKALRLAMDCHRNENTEEAARFFWETGESGDMELSPTGPWLSHVFHMCVVGLGAYEYYTYTLDRAFLSRCYRMIRACAKFFSIWMIYELGDGAYIGKCMDLERLGAGAENPFMTACGVIKLLEVCAEASEILGIDTEYRSECRAIAAKLRSHLPKRDGMYVPLLSSEQKSIAVFAAKFPFDVLAADDEAMQAAWQDFEENGAAYGNMYVMGKSISSWYAAWKAEAYARTENTAMAYRSLRQACASRGVFHELFEINEEGVRIKPWFTTAHGMFLSSVNEMLVQSEGKRVRLLPAFPPVSAPIEFKLPLKGAATIEARIQGKTLTYVRILRDGADVTSEYDICLDA